MDSAKLDAFLGKAVSDIGAALHAALVVTGDRLGLFKAMAGAGPLTPEQLAQRTKTTERYVREWLNAMSAGGYVCYCKDTKTYSLPEEQAFALADESSPAFLPGAFQIVASVLRDEPKITAAFQSGEGVGWHEHDANLFEGTERFFRPNYVGNLISNWIPALEGVEEKLRRGAKVADVGCGHGASTLLMAREFPNSEFVGFDYHRPSIERATARARDAGLGERVRFETADSRKFPGSGYDLVACFDCLHDMGDPVAAARHVREALAKDGTWMIVEPFAGDRVEDNLNPVGRVFYCASTMICTPASMSQEGRMALGAQAGEAKLREIATRAGFGRFRRATETPFNLVLEARR